MFIGRLLILFVLASGCVGRSALNSRERLSAPWECFKPVLASKPEGYRPNAWSIGIMTGSSPIDLIEASEVRNPVLAAQDVTDRKARFVADPFLIKSDTKWHMFFEVMNCGSEQGDIAAAESDDGLSWRYLGVVLDEPFHLSFPQVFTHSGRYYMIPESRQAGAIRLYMAQEFPHKWSLVKDLIPGSFADASIVFHENRWWLFTVGDHYSLTIYFSDSLLGPWQMHPGSPFYDGDKSRTRSAGRIISYQGKLVRFAQDNRLRYGGAVRAFVIDSLTPHEFIEHPVERDPILAPEGHGWREIGMHQIDALQLSPNSWIAAVDGTGYVPESE